jgi:hypothetical protein
MFFLESPIKKTHSFFDRPVSMVSFLIKMFFAPDLACLIIWHLQVDLTTYS